MRLSRWNHYQYSSMPYSYISMHYQYSSIPYSHTSMHHQYSTTSYSYISTQMICLLLHSSVSSCINNQQSPATSYIDTAIQYTTVTTVPCHLGAFIHCNDAECGRSVISALKEKKCERNLPAEWLSFCHAITGTYSDEEFVLLHTVVVDEVVNSKHRHLQRRGRHKVAGLSLVYWRRRNEKGTFQLNGYLLSWNNRHLFWWGIHLFPVFESVSQWVSQHFSSTLYSPQFLI